MLIIRKNDFQPKEKADMPSAINLPPRRYSVLDSVVIAFRCAPIAAFFYGFFELAWAALTPVTTLVAARLIDAVIQTARDGAPVEDIHRYLALLAGLTAFGWLRSALHNLADLRLTLALRARYRTALTNKRTRLEYALLEQSDSWDLIQRVAANPEGGRLKQTYFHLVDLAAFVLKVTGLLALLTSAVWWAPLMIFIVGGFALVTGVRGGKTLYKAERQAAEHDRRMDYLSGVLLGREAAAERTLFGSSSMLSAMWRNAFRSAFSMRLGARLRWYVNSYSGNLANQVIWVLIMLVMLPSLQRGTVSIGLFIALTQAFTRFDIVWGFMDTVNGIAADAEFFKDLTAFLILPDEFILPTKPLSIPLAASALIELRDVHFRYPGTQRYVLNGLSLTLEAGKCYALVGANGCGKTTVTRLLTRLYPIESGSIWINGRDLREVPAEELRGLISVVYQDFARYSVSLSDNVFLGLEHPDDGQVFNRAGLGQLVARLPQGLDTPLGKITEDGVDISGGEWQRIAIARSLARPAALRILDEPAAALDPVAESELYASFENLTEGATTLLITHRLGATKTADVILVLDGGHIVEAGSHTELIRSGGLYARMYASQRYWYEAN
jgi:ATP-binding cassette subfamily B protein